MEAALHRFRKLIRAHMTSGGQERFQNRLARGGAAHPPSRHALQDGVDLVMRDLGIHLLSIVVRFGS